MLLGRRYLPQVALNVCTLLLWGGQPAPSAQRCQVTSWVTAAISRAHNAHAVLAWRKQITKKGVINGGEWSGGDVLCQGGGFPVA
ncbi:MAG: hypothetical protein ACPIOQ_54190, partial [Promethearchaeia archaeon]